KQQFGTSTIICSSRMPPVRLSGPARASSRLDRSVTVITNSVGHSVRPLFLSRGFDDLGETARVETGTTDEGAVNVGLAHEFAGILRFYTAAVLNPYAVSGFVISHFAQGMPNERVRFLCLLGGCVPPCAARPNRFVRDHAFLHFFRLETSDTASQLHRQYFFHVAFVALIECFADANDWTQFRFVRGAHFAIYHFIGLAE